MMNSDFTAVKNCLNMMKKEDDGFCIGFYGVEVQIKNIPGRGQMFLIAKGKKHFQRATVDAATAVILEGRK